MLADVVVVDDDDDDDDGDWERRTQYANIRFQDN